MGGVKFSNDYDEPVMSCVSDLIIYVKLLKLLNFT